MDDKEWKDRLVKEYIDLKTRYNNIHHAIVAFEAGVLSDAPKEGINIWKEQAKYMGLYLFVLEKRMAINKI